jgi:hypothetical protein
MVHWTRGRYDDGNGGHCLRRRSSAFEPRASPAGSASDCVSTGCDATAGPSVYALQRYRCGSVAELRAVILKARRSSMTMRSESGQRRLQDLAARSD